MDNYEHLTSEQKAAVLDTLVYASELFTTENLPFLLEAILLQQVALPNKVQAGAISKVTTKESKVIKENKPLSEPTGKAKVTTRQPANRKGKSVVVSTQTGKDKETLPTKVDIFDFVTYKKEHAALACYYSGLELHLRTALLLERELLHMDAAIHVFLIC